jgi:hypothetical protein
VSSDSLRNLEAAAVFEKIGDSGSTGNSLLGISRYRIRCETQDVQPESLLPPETDFSVPLPAHVRCAAFEASPRRARGQAIPRIHKQDWKPRAEFETEIGATNVIYMLVDTEKRLFYVGEAERLIQRFRQGHDAIPKWDYYRYDALPAALADYRLQIERMLIRDIDGLLGESTQDLPVVISEFELVNKRIDR